MEEINMSELLSYYKKKIKRMIKPCLLIFIILMVLFAIFKRPSFETKTSIIISNDSTKNMISTYTGLLTSDTVINEGIEKSEVNISKSYIKDRLTLGAVEGSRLFEIKLNCDFRYNCKKVNEGITKALISTIKDNYKVEAKIVDDTTSSSICALVIDYIKLVAISLALALAIVLVYIFILFYFDDSIKSEESLNKYNIIGKLNDANTKEIELLKTKLLLSYEEAKIIHITSIEKETNKKIIDELINLLKKDNKKVALISNDKKTSNIEDLDKLKNKNDYIIINSSNALDSKEALQNASLSDINIILVTYNKTKNKELNKLNNTFKEIHTNIDGIIINKN